MTKVHFNENERLALIGFIISRTIDVERSLTYFICKYYSNNDIKSRDQINDLITEFSYNKKINIFFRIVKAGQVKFNCSQELLEKIDRSKTIRNHFAHDPFSLDEDQIYYNFINANGKLTKYSKNEIDKHWEICKYIEDEVRKLCIKI